MKTLTPLVIYFYSTVQELEYRSNEIISKEIKLWFLMRRCNRNTRERKQPRSQGRSFHLPLRARSREENNQTQSAYDVEARI